MKNRYILPIAIFLISFVIYIFTLSPTVSFTDNGELAGAAYSLGVGHPSGYPLLSIIGHLWLFIPTGWTVIYKLNILSAVFASTSILIFYHTACLFADNMKLGASTENSVKSKRSKHQTASLIKSPLSGDFSIRLISASMAVAFAFSSIIWEQAVVFEVYSLQFLLINSTLYFLFRAVFDSTNKQKYYMLSGLFMGLSFANHLTTILLVPAILFIYFKNPDSKFELGSRNLKNLIWIFLIVLAGVSIYMYMPLRSMSEPDFNWGYVHRSFDKFLYHVQGKQYQVWMFSGMDVAKENFVKFVERLPYNLAFVGFIPLFAGIIRLFKTSNEIFWFLLILSFSCIFYSVNYSIHDIDVYFYIAVYAIMMFCIAGLVSFIENYSKYKYIIFLIPLINISVNYTEHDKSNNYLVYDYTRSVVDNLGEGAVVISSQWDYWVSAFWYLQKVENYRPDIVLVEKELLRRTWYIKQFAKWYPETADKCRDAFDNYLNDLEKFESDMPINTYPNIQENFVNLLECLIETNIDEKPVYVTFDYMNAGPDAEPLKTYNIVPSGFAFKLNKDRAPIKVSFDKIYPERLIDYRKDPRNHLEQGILETSAMNLVNIGRYALATGDKVAAEKAYKLAIEIMPDNELAVRALRELQP